MNKIAATLIFICLLIGAAQAQQSYLITKNSAGAVRLGMTIAQVRKARPGFRLSRISDGDGLVLVAVDQNGKTVMHLYAGEEDPKAKINENAKVEFIEVWDKHYITADGIYPTMPVKTAEKLLGSVESVFKSEIEAREFVIFKKKPQGLWFRVDADSSGQYLYAGIYPEGKREGRRCVPTAFILSVQVSDYRADDN